MHGHQAGRGGGEGGGAVREADRGGGRPGGPPRRADAAQLRRQRRPGNQPTTPAMAMAMHAAAAMCLFRLLRCLAFFLALSLLLPRVHALQAATARQNTCFHDPHSIMCVEYNSIKWKR